MVAAPSPSVGTRPQFPAAAKSEPKAAAAQQGVVSDFIIQTPEEAAAKPKPGSLQPGQEFTLKNAIFTKKPEFRYVLRFKKGSPVTGYRIVFTRIADLDLKKALSTGEQGKAPYLPLGDTFAKKEKIGENHFRGSLILADLPDGVYKIYAQVTSGGQSSTTYWLPEFTGDILDGVVILDKAGKYKDKQQYVETVDKNYYVLKYGAEKTEKFYPLLVEARNARKSLDASGDSIQRFIRREGFVRKLLELARVKANVAFKEKPREKYEAVQKQVYRDLWADKLADLYLPLEKGLAAEKRTLCDKPLWETSPSSPKYSDPMHDESYQCFSTQQRDEAKVRKETEVKLVYLEYMVAGLNAYKQGKGSLSLEDAVDALNKGFVQYLAATASSIKKETNRLEAIYKDDVIPNENGLALKTPGVRKQAAGRGAGPAVDLPTTFNIKISEKTCSRVNSLAFSGGLPKVNELESGPVLPSDAKAFGGASSGDAITPGGYSMLLQFCKNYAKFWNADKVLQYAKSHKALPSSVLSAKGDKPASTRYSAENPKMEREILAYLTDQSRRFEQYGAYNEIGNIAFFKGAAQQPDPALATKFNFAKCIEPYTTPSFAVATLGFVGLAALTGGSSVAATLVGGAGDAMMVVSAMQLAGSKEADVNRIACDFAFFALSVPMSATVGKVREKAVELKKAKLDAKAREAFDLFARGVEAKAKAEVPRGSYEIMDPFKGVAEGAGREPKKKMTFECAFAASAACGGEAQSFTSRGISREPPAASDTLQYSFFEGTLAETYVHVQGKVIRYSQNPQGASGVFYKTNQGVQYQTLDPYSSLTVEHGGQSATVSPNQGVTVQPGMTLRLGGLMEIKISAPGKNVGWFENLFNKKAKEQAKPQDEPQASQKQQGKPPKAEPETLTWRGGEDGRSAAGTLDAGAVEVEGVFGFNRKSLSGYGEIYGVFKTKPPEHRPDLLRNFMADIYEGGVGRKIKPEPLALLVSKFLEITDGFAITLIDGTGEAYIFKTLNTKAFIVGRDGSVRAVKSSTEAVQINQLGLKPGEKVVLTTKGVHQVVSEAEIGNFVKQYGSTEKAIIGILSKAKQRSDPSKTYRTDDGQTVQGLLDDASVTIHDYNPAKAGETTPPKQESARPPEEPRKSQGNKYAETVQSDSDGKSATAFILPKNSLVSGAGFNSQPGREMYAVFRSKDNSLPLDAIREQLSRDYSSGAPSATIRGNIERSNADGTVILVDRDRVYRFSSADTPVRTYVLRSTGQFEHINQLGGYMDLRTGDKVIMLSSDVYNAVSVSELRGILSSHRNLKDALISLLNRVKERSGSLAGEREGAAALGFEYDANRVGTPSAGNGGQQAGTPGSRPQQGAGASGQLLIAGKPITSAQGKVLAERYLAEPSMKELLAKYIYRSSDGKITMKGRGKLTEEEVKEASGLYRQLYANYHPDKFDPNMEPDVHFAAEWISREISSINAGIKDRT